MAYIPIFTSHPTISIQFWKGTYLWMGKKLYDVLRSPRRQGTLSSNFHHCQPHLAWGSVRSIAVALCVLSYLLVARACIIQTYTWNAGIQTNRWDNQRVMVGMRVFLVDHAQSIQWSWIKSSMSIGSSKVLKLHPSVPLGMYKERCRPSTLPCPQKLRGGIW